jgi:hypothetical protein
MWWPGVDNHAEVVGVELQRARLTWDRKAQSLSMAEIAGGPFDQSNLLAVVASRLPPRRWVWPARSGARICSSG